MNVTELIKAVKKGEKKPFDIQIEDIISPQLIEYWNELWQNAKNNHWLNWRYNGESPLDSNPATSSFDLHRSPAPAIATQNEQAHANEAASFIGEWYTVSQEHIDDFARVTEDRQWIHVDVERAQRESIYRSTIAHGFLTLSLIPKLTQITDTEKTQFPEYRFIFNTGIKEVNFISPVKSGSRIRARKKIISTTAVKNGAIVEEEIIIEIENRSRPACSATLMYRLVF